MPDNQPAPESKTTEESVQEAANQDAGIALANSGIDWSGILEEPTFICGRTESITDAQSATFRPWPVRRITWTVIAESFPRVSAAQVVEAFRAAWDSWAKGIDIEPVFVETEEEALVVSRFGRIDGGGKVLAWSELSNGAATQKHQLYDLSEMWERSATAATGIDLDRVAAHEIGHVLGLVHDAENSGALMAPMYSRSLRWPTARDINRMIELGYRRASDPPKPPADEGMLQVSAAMKISDVIEGLAKLGYKVTK